MPHTEAVEIIMQGKGRHFDPDVVDAFIARQDEFQGDCPALRRYRSRSKIFDLILSFKQS